MSPKSLFRPHLSPSALTLRLRAHDPTHPPWHQNTPLIRSRTSHPRTRSRLAGATATLSSPQIHSHPHHSLGHSLATAMACSSVPGTPSLAGAVVLAEVPGRSADSRPKDHGEGTDTFRP
jgi:hypothetical protein